jgi:RNA polymerase sigma-70 factor (TIGR02943 family)
MKFFRHAPGSMRGGIMLNLEPVPTEDRPPAALPLRWLDLYGDDLFSYAMRKVRRSEAAEDLVQETLLAGLQSWGRFAERSNVRTWLIGILKNKITDHLRARYRNLKLDHVRVEEDQLFNRHGEWKVSLKRWGTDPAELAEMGEFRAALDGCVSKLPAQMSYLFLSKVSGQPTIELCAELDISADNAWTLLHRARLRLRQCLSSSWFDSTAQSKKRRSP